LIWPPELYSRSSPVTEDHAACLFPLCPVRAAPGRARRPIHVALLHSAQCEWLQGTSSGARRSIPCPSLSTDLPRPSRSSRYTRQPTPPRYLLAWIHRQQPPVLPRSAAARSILILCVGSCRSLRPSYLLWSDHFETAQQLQVGLAALVWPGPTAPGWPSRSIWPSY
jgi:hypothetical protein